MQPDLVSAQVGVAPAVKGFATHYATRDSHRMITMKTEPSGDLLTRAKRSVSYWYTQYELILCINMFEPWEKMLLNTFIAATALMVCYSSFVYLPNYMISLVNRSLLFMQQRPEVSPEV
ncbi:hypothetical protein GE061_001372 [Apolygus lucorum]|uniref:Serine palmitoyltransferase small subunit B n=1 Tax=Apolygus lucorum TaxID=248454 RepID=A0A8S9Y6W7_APOLU|nr:hypothetical protein GE061_001372 [Apolygus lucorum]